ncbi:MAG: hypothetical protein ABI068_05190, partial [Ktedonobacterales bacterium]
MDERRERASRPRQSASSAGQGRGGTPQPPARASQPTRTNGANAATGKGGGGGLLSRYSANDAANDAGSATPQQAPAQSAGNEGGLLSRARAQRGGKSAGTAGTAGAAGGSGARQGREAIRTLAGQAKRLGANIRRATSGAAADTAGDDRSPRAGEWKASDFDARELEAWDRYEAVPFDLPPNPDDSGEQYAARNDRSVDRGSSRRSRRRGDWDDLDDRDWDDQRGGGWETGSWDVNWATGLHTGSGADDGWGDEWDDPQGDLWQPGGVSGGWPG